MPEPRDMPLVHWGAEIRRIRRARRRLAVRLALGAAALLAILVTIARPPVPRLFWNVSASAPEGLYVVMPGAVVEPGDRVATRLPRAWRSFAADRGYIPSGVPLVKRVAAGEGQAVCGIGETIFVGGIAVASRLEKDGKGRSMPWWAGCVILGRDEYFLLTHDHPASFDGRYFGVSQREDLIGRARRLWSR